MELTLDSLNNELKNQNKRIHKCELALGIVDYIKDQRRSQSVKKKDREEHKKDEHKKKDKHKDKHKNKDEDKNKDNENKDNENQIVEIPIQNREIEPMTNKEQELQSRIEELEFSLNLFLAWFGASILNGVLYHYGKPVGNKSFLSMEQQYIISLCQAVLKGKLDALDEFKDSLVELNIKYSSILNNYKQLFEGFLQIHNPNRLPN
jgi:hypothetical protein